ncbi:hypothetical protein N7520_001074 [Penicillium odoratum]|uniref:uncharacterized protein n=1 Tax=Penicillium odoratum TaxID=1167516 RepID=UPI00254729BA|nr:uncharacterized protein N7520_001074 [Penicillium odoratum]KAJ5777828.1 hypothetical protein N7520_001074 [Penicillium odoratum]
MGVRYELETPRVVDTLSRPSLACREGDESEQGLGAEDPGSVSRTCIWPMLDGGKAPAEAGRENCRTNEMPETGDRLPVVTH